MRIGMRLLVGLSVVAFLLIGPQADAACHAFGVESLSQVAEGNKLQVTITRDADVNGSSVRVTTVNETAKAPADFTAINQRVSWTAGGGTEKTITISTKEDSLDEPSETFSVKVSDAQGCNPPNTNYTYEDPKRITIADDDAARTVPATPAPTKTPAPQAAPLTTTPTPTATPSPTPKATKTPKPSPTPPVTALAVTAEDDDGFPWLPVAAVAGFLAAAGGALILTRMRRGGI